MSSLGVPFSRPVVAPEASQALERVLHSGWLTTGPECAAFENEFASWVGAEHAVTASSCTTALELSLRALHLPAGAQVLTPTVTFCGAVEAIVHAGLVPVLADVDLETGQVSPHTCAAAAHAAGGVDAMVVLHFAGFPAPVIDLAAAAGVPLSRVVEDAAHGLGTWVGDHQVGRISRATCFSFYATKSLPIGEGGMVTTDDGHLATWLRSARMHGIAQGARKRTLPGSWEHSVREQGVKGNLSDVHAAIGRVQLRHLHAWQRRRRTIAKRYSAALSHIPGLQLPKEPVTGRHAWHLYTVRVKPTFGITRDELIQHLTAYGIGTSVHFMPAHHMPWFRQVAVVSPRGLPNADVLFRELVSLPLYPALTDDQVDQVVAAIDSARHRGHTTTPVRDFGVRRVHTASPVGLVQNQLVPAQAAPRHDDRR
jgi:dTDP-4-amino-4,6-dideoxygalactose transaminase